MSAVGGQAMKKYVYLCLAMISLYLCGCQSEENKYPLRSLQVLGWTRDDNQIVFQYQNLKHDIGYEDPQDSDYQESIYLYHVKDKSLKKVFTFPELVSKDEGRGRLFYHAPSHRIYFQLFNLLTETASIAVVDLETQSVEKISETYPYIQGNRTIVSPSGRYAYITGMKDKVYDIIEHSFKTWSPIPEVRLDFHWFEQDKQLHFLTEYGIYRLSPDIANLELVNTIELPEGNKFSFVALKDKSTLYYLDRSDDSNSVFFEYDLNQNVLMRTNSSIHSWDTPKPEQLSHDKSQLAYIDNHQVVLLSFSDQSKRKILIFENFPAGGLQTGPPDITDPIF